MHSIKQDHGPCLFDKKLFLLSVLLLCVRLDIQSKKIKTQPPKHDIFAVNKMNNRFFAHVTREEIGLTYQRTINLKGVESLSLHFSLQLQLEPCKLCINRIKPHFDEA